MDEIFKSHAPADDLPLAEERTLIASAQAGDSDSVWSLILHYRRALQLAAWRVRKAVRTLTPQQIEDLEADLILTAVTTIQNFDSTRFVRLGQVLAGRLRDTATSMATALVVPRGTLSLWFKIWRAADQDTKLAEVLAPDLGMSASTFRAINHALAHAESDWVSIPFAAAVPTADEETYHLAHHALDVLTPSERDVIELAYGFRGEPKTDEEVSLIREASKRTVKEQRTKALAKMRKALTDG